MKACRTCGSTGDWRCLDCPEFKPSAERRAHNRIYSDDEERKAEYARRARIRYQARKHLRPKASGDNVETTLYRAYGVDGQLLYVGITRHFEVRLAQHRRYSDWFPSAHRWTIETYPTRRRAKSVETQAIREEGPLFNRHESII